MKLVIATHNRDKAAEIRDILGGLDVELSTLDDYREAPHPVEDGDTLTENALKKARAIRDFTGHSSLADDTGLEVDALEGAPGIYAARYAGENATYDDNCNRILSELEGVPEEERTARFRTVMALALDSDDTARLRELLSRRPDVAGTAHVPAADALVTEGMLPGRITIAKRGRGGFGYDPVFLETNSGHTLAEMTSAEKNATSHRYRALIEMRELILRVGLAREVS